MSFQFLQDNINPGLHRCIINKKWKNYSEIQIKSFEIIFNGDDCVVEAPTSGGKTEAVLFPTLSKIAKVRKTGVRILYLAPLKALLNNIELRANEYSIACGFHSFKWHGDVTQSKKLVQFANPSELLLTTPESLEAILLRKPNWQEYFQNLQSVIIDETHNFAGSDRGVHLLSLLERLDYFLKNSPQRIAMTATIGNPDGMLNWLAGTKRTSGKRIQVVSNSKKEKQFEVHFFDKVFDESSKVSASEHIFENLYNTLTLKKSLVFTRSRSGTESLATMINEKNQSLKTKNTVKVRTHHSSVSKFYREQAEFLIQVKNDSTLNSIINTCTLELGIDIGELDQVIQLSSLTHPSSFLQRVGRTGRREGKPQVFKGYCIDKEELLLTCAVINLGLTGKSEEMEFPDKVFHILAHQLICLALQMNGVNPEVAWDVLSGVYSFSGISKEDFDELVAYMVSKDFLRFVDSVLVVGEKGEHSFLGLNWRRLFAVFDSAPMYDVIDGKTHIGTLDCNFVESRKLPFIFVLGGIEWIAKEVRVKNRQVLAVKTSKGTAPKWNTAPGYEVPFETAQEAGIILKGTESFTFLNENGLNGLQSLRNEYLNIHWSKDNWFIDEIVPGKIYIWTFAGSKINTTLSFILGHFGIFVKEYDYKYLSVFKDNDFDTLKNNIEDILQRVINLRDVELGHLENMLSEMLECKEFSKFSPCLPKNLCKKNLGAGLFDVRRLRDFLKTIQV